MNDSKQQPPALDAAAEQATPRGQGTPIVELVKADLERRAQAGELKYGERLRANNGRNAVLDAYQEAIDLAMYLRQELAERDELRAKVARMTDLAILQAQENNELRRQNAAIRQVMDVAYDESSGIGLIVAERQRQVSKEGWTLEHDDEHKCAELTMAAISYAKYQCCQNRWPSLYAGCDDPSPPDEWPWDKVWWRPSDQIRNLAKAGALIAAEIDRLKRLGAKD